MDNTGEPLGPENVMYGSDGLYIYVYGIDLNIEWLISFSNKHLLLSKKIVTLPIVLSLVQSTRCEKLSVQVCN